MESVQRRVDASGLREVEVSFQDPYDDRKGSVVVGELCDGEGVIVSLCRLDRKYTETLSLSHAEASALIAALSLVNLPVAG